MFRKFSWIPVCILALSAFWCCQLSEDKNSGKVLLTIETDSTYLRFGKLWVGYTDSTGADTSVIWAADSLPSLDKLKKVPVSIPAGRVIHLVIKGFQSGTGKLIYEEVRIVDLTTGQETGASTPLDLTKQGLRPPKVSFVNSDTVISIGDKLNFSAMVVDTDGIVFSYAWDLEGSGKYGPEFAFDKDSVSLKNSHIYPAPGKYPVVIRIKDASRKAYYDTVIVTVIQDPPKADAGLDVGVMINQLVHLHGQGRDSMGQVISYEWRLDDGPFSISKNGDTDFVAPQNPIEQQWILRVTDDDGNQTEDTLRVSVTYGSDSFLASLSTSGVKFAPEFERSRFTYSADVPYATDTLEIHLKAEDPNALVKVGGVELSAGDSIEKLPLQVGGNLIPIVIKAQNGADTAAYSLFITRKKNDDATLSNLSAAPGALSPQFSKDTLDYFVTLENGQNSLSITPNASDTSNAKVFVNGVPRISGVAGDPISIQIGVDTIKIVVVAQDDSSKRNYRVIVSRLPSPDATLKNIELSVGSLKPGFSPNVIHYSDTVANVVTGVALKPTLGNANSKLYLNGDSISPGTFTNALPLAVGDNSLRLKVVAENGDTGVYLVTLRRRSANASLSTWTINPGKLIPDFSVGLTSYSDTVSTGVDSVSISIKAADPSVRSIRVGNMAANSAVFAGTLGVGDGNNPFSVVVTAEDGNSVTYNLSVYRRNGDATLKGLEASSGILVPAFSFSNNNYSIVFGNLQTEVAFKATPNNPLSSIYLGGKKIGPGTFSEQLQLSTGDNFINLKVVSENGDSLTYTVKVHRKSVDANLVSLRVDNGNLRPAFTPNGSVYRDTVGAGTKSILVTAVAEDRFVQSITINGSLILSDSATISIPINGLTSSNPVGVTVKAEEGGEKNYFIRIFGSGFIRLVGTNDDDDAFSITPTRDGGYAFAEYSTANFQPSNTSLVKLNADGDTLWKKPFSNQGPYVSEVLAANNGDLIVCGTGNVQANGADIYLARYDEKGVVIWEKYIGSPDLDEEEADVIPTIDGGFAIVGTRNDSLRSDIIVIKTNSSGDTLWSHSFGVHADNEYPFSMIQLNDGGYLITGETQIDGTQVYTRTFLLRLDTSGKSLWMKNYGGWVSNRGRGVELAPDGGFLIAGGTSSPGLGGKDAMVLKTNENGDSLWTKIYGTAGDDGFIHISKTADGGFALSGYAASSSGAANKDAYLVKTDVGLNVAWSKTYGGSNDDYLVDGIPTSDGGFILSGSTASFGAVKRDCLIIRTNSQGDAE